MVLDICNNSLGTKKFTTFYKYRKKHYYLNVEEWNFTLQKRTICINCSKRVKITTKEWSTLKSKISVKYAGFRVNFQESEILKSEMFTLSHFREYKHCLVQHIRHCTSILTTRASDNECSQGRNQPHSPGWARVPLSSLFLKFWSIFLIFPYFLPHFGLPGGRLPGRP